MLSIVVLVNWTISQPINVTEGDGIILELVGSAFGIYAKPIEIGVACAEVIATDVLPGMSTISSTDTKMLLVWIVVPHFVLLLAALPGKDFNFTAGARLHFTDTDTLQSLSSDQAVIPIINDDIAEPCESFICTLQGGGVDSVQSTAPNRVTIEICDDDGGPMHVL